MRWLLGGWMMMEWWVCVEDREEGGLYILLESREFLLLCAECLC